MHNYVLFKSNASLVRPNGYTEFSVQFYFLSLLIIFLH